jgi:hypothetical protein
MGSSGRRGSDGGHGPESDAGKGCSHIDDRGPDPLRDIYGRALTLFGFDRGADPSARDTYDLGRACQLCETRAAGYLELACFSHGRVIFAGSTFLR